MSSDTFFKIYRLLRIFKRRPNNTASGLASALISLSVLISSHNVNADTVKLAAGYTKQPYINAEQQTGIELDIVREAFKEVGHQVEFEYFPSRRLATEMSRFKLDGALTQPNRQFPDYFLSDSYITYQNSAFGLAQRNLPIVSISDLSHYRVVGFQRAFEVLGADFSQMAKANAHYSELANQKNQVAMLLAGRTDLVVMDRHIFHYYRRLNPRGEDQPSSEFTLFPPSHYHLLLASPTLLDDFNRGLAQLKRSGRYQQLADMPRQ